MAAASFAARKFLRAFLCAPLVLAQAVRAEIRPEAVATVSINVRKRTNSIANRKLS